MTMVDSRATLTSVASSNALELRGVTKMFGALAAISDVTFSVRSGERRAVLGSNGAARPRSSTASPAISCPHPARSGCSARM